MHPPPPFSGNRLRRVLTGAVLFGAAALGAAPGPAWGYTATLTPVAPLTVYLQVGVGSFTGDYINGGQPQNNTTINTVSATIAAAVVGNGTAQAMTTNSTATQSYWDGYTYCSVPGQVYIGGFYRTTGATTSPATVSPPPRPGAPDKSRGKHDSVFKNRMAPERHRRYRRRAVSRRHLRQRRRAKR